VKDNLHSSVNKVIDPVNDSDASKSLELDKGPSKIGVRTWRSAGRRPAGPIFTRLDGWRWRVGRGGR
jgi:hypothetical protein